VTTDCIISPDTLKCIVCGSAVSSAGVRRNCAAAPIEWAKFRDALHALPSTAINPLPPDEPRDVPDFLQRVKNFTVAAVGHVAAGMPTCTEQEIIARHDICLTCPHLTGGLCELCGCPIARAAGYFSKLSWADQECPAGKWGRIERRE
jgi:hypothetical protein